MQLSHLADEQGGRWHYSVMIAIKDKFPFNSNLDYYLSSVAKLCMPLDCYSEPDLLKESNKKTRKASNYTLFGL
jgi:hypothetical protein